MRSWNEQARHQSPDHFSSYWALHLDRALQRTEGIVSMNDFARKPARQQAVRLNPLPSYFAQPFPQPKINGSPKRWRLSDLLAWEDNVGIKPEADQPASQGDPAKQQASDADHPDNHAGYNVP